MIIHPEKSNKSDFEVLFSIVRVEHFLFENLKNILRFDISETVSVRLTLLLKSVEQTFCLKFNFYEEYFLFFCILFLILLSSLNLLFKQMLK